MTPSTIYRKTLEEIARALGEGDGVAAAVDLLHDRLDRYSWVGFYRVEGNELVLGPWRGPRATEHVRIPVAEGIGGPAAASGSTELVVPVVRDGRMIGEIDVDCDEPGAFDDADRAFLERVGRLLALVDTDPASTLDGVVDEWGRGSFPASDPPSRWAGSDARA